MKINFTIATTTGTTLNETRTEFLGTLQEAKEKASEILATGKNSVSVSLLGTCYFLQFASGRIAINK